MKIQVLGTGCPKCRKLKENVAQAVARAGIDCDVEEVTDIERIVEFDVMTTPALVIDGQVQVAGTVPPSDRIAGWLRDRADVGARENRKDERRDRT